MKKLELNVDIDVVGFYQGLIIVSESIIKGKKGKGTKRRQYSKKKL